MKILITTSSFGKIDPEPLEKLKRAGFEVVTNPYGRKVTVEELRQLLPGAVALIAGTESIDRETMEKSILKVISRVGVGMDSIDLEAAKDLGIVVKNTPSAPTVAVAELTLNALLCLFRQLPQMNQDLHNKSWNQKTGIQLLGKTVLIIGFGRIGQYLAKLLEPFKVKLLVVDPNYPQGISLQEALPQADVICLHPGGKQQILGSNEFALMKKGVFVLNAARGGVVNENDLIEALKEEKVAGAWFDVFSSEPYVGPLTEFSQVILTPHIGSNTKESRVQMEKEAVDNLLTVLI